MEKNLMSAPALALSTVPQIDLSKTTLLSLSFHLGIGRLKQTKLRVQTDADESLLRHQKKLLESPELDAVRSADSAMRRWVELKTVPFTEGISFLSLALLEEVMEELAAYEVKRQGLIDVFLAVYEAQVEAARKSLGGLFRSADYPSRLTVAVGFAFNYRIVAISVPERLAAINSRLFKRETEKYAKQMEQAAAEARTLLRVTIAETVDHLVDVLTPTSDGKRKKFFASSVEHVQEFLNTFNFRDITDDAALQVEVLKLKGIMHGVTPEKVKESDNLKAKLQSSFAEASKTLATLVETAPARRFR